MARAVINTCRALCCSDRLVIFDNDEFCLVRFVLNRENLTRTEVHNLPDFVQQRQSRPLVENMDSTIAVSLLKDVGTGEHTVAAGNTLLGIRDHAHVITPFLICYINIGNDNI